MSSHLQRRAILAYHEVMAESDYAYCVPVSKFREQMRMLSVQAEAGVTAQVTFDDGERSEKEIAGACTCRAWNQSYVFHHARIDWYRTQVSRLGRTQGIAGGGTFGAVTRMVA